MKHVVALFTLLIPVTVFAENNLRLYLPFDGDCQPSVSSSSSMPYITGKEPVFAEGIRGKGLVIGGKGSARITYKGTEFIDTAQGTIMFWVKSLDWNATEDVMLHYFNLLDKSFFYKYVRHKNAFAFYTKVSSYDTSSYYRSNLPLRKDEWFHVTITWLDRILKVYINGKVTTMSFMREPLHREWHGKGIGFGSPYTDKHIVMDEFYIFDYPLGGTRIARVFESSQDGAEPEIPGDTPYRIYTAHFPGMHKVYVCVDSRYAEDAARMARARIAAVDHTGKRYVLGLIQEFSASRGNAYFSLPKEIPAGMVSITVDLIDASSSKLGTVVSEAFEKRIYPWQEENVGVSDEVIAPFTPLDVKGRSVFCWGREYRFGNDGLLEKVITRKKQILASPIRLSGNIDGEDLDWGEGRFQIVSQKPGKIEFVSLFQAGGVKGEVDGTIEYDGMIRYHLRLLPEKRSRIQRLTLEIPLKEEHALLYHACRDWIRRSNEAGYVPRGEGKVWGSSAKRSRSVLGTFLPYFWLGDYDRGFCWMADNDKGWSVPDNEDCIEFVREGKTLLARINFVRKGKVIQKPWEVTFALMAGPPRPEPKSWRMDTQGPTWFYLPWGNRTCQGYGKPPEMEKWRTHAERMVKERGFWGMNTSPNDFWGVTEENLYFQLEWKANPNSGYPLTQRNSFVAYTIDQLMEEGLVDGIYSDDVYPVPYYSPVTGCGYLLDDGRLQAGYSMFALRDFFKRLAYLYRKHNCKGYLKVHMTDSMIMPCYSFWDIKHDNEWGRTHTAIESYPLGEICARSMSRQYGMSASWHTPIEWSEGPEPADELACLLLLHDILGRSPTMENRILPAKTLFGFGEDDVEFLGYWVLQPDRDPSKKDVKISAWVRKKPGAAIVVVANLTKQDWQGKIKLPLEVMGLKGDAVACDGEERHQQVPFQDGNLELSVLQHNYRFILIGPAGKFPVDLPSLGTELEKPAHLIPKLCDDFGGEHLDTSWKLVCSPVSGGHIRLYRNRLQVLGSDYKFAAAERRFGEDNVSVQVRIETFVSGSQNRKGLALMWEDGNYVFAGPLLHVRLDNRFSYAYKAGNKVKSKWGSPANTDNPGRMHQFNWVKVSLTPEKVIFYGSSDGREWSRDWEIERPTELTGAPAVLRMGKSPAGHEAKHKPRPTVIYFDNLIVGRD